MPVEILPLKPSPNWDIMNAIRADASSAYQDRVPEATKANVQDAVRNLLDWRPGYNEFVESLVNQIGLVLIRNTSWTNPLAEFKTGLLTYGDTIQEIKVGLLKAHTYNTDREYLEKDIFGTERVQVETNYHTITRQEFYKITVNEALLKRAFLEPMGLNSFISQLMAAPATSDSWDEFLQTCNLFKEYEANGGFYKVQVPDVSALESNEGDAKRALRRMRELADNLTFLSTSYNAAKMPTFINKDDLLIFCTPAFKAALDVEALAAAFNLDQAVARGRIIVIPEDQFNIKGAQAIVTSKDFFIIGDTLFETRSAENPVGLHTNFFLHHHSIISASRFVPAILLTTEPGNEELMVRTPVTAVSEIDVFDREGNLIDDVQRGEIYPMDAEAITAPEGGVNDGVRWSVSGASSARTFVTQDGVLHVGPREGAQSLTVTATSTWLDEENLAQPGKTSSTTLTVSGDSAPAWDGSIVKDGETAPAVAAAE